MHAAANEGRTSIIAALKEANANVNACSQDGHTPLALATKSKHYTTVMYLLKHCNAIVNLIPGMNVEVCTC